MKPLKHLRNELWACSFSKTDQKQLESIYVQAQEFDSPFIPLIRFCISNALEEIAEQKFKAASVELNVVHDIPFSIAEMGEWDWEWFYKNALHVYFEKSKNAMRLQKFVGLLAQAQSQCEFSEYSE